MHHQYRLSVLQWNPGPGPARRTPPISSRRLVDGFIRLSFKKPAIMFLTSPISSLRTVLLIVRGLLRRPSLSGTPTVTCCSVHIHNVVAKKRDPSIDLLRRLHGYMREHNVDFIGGDFNMSAFSTVGEVFEDPEFSAPGNSFLLRLGALEEPNRECAGFLIMPKRPCEWCVDSHGCYKYDNAALGHLALEPVTKPLTFLCFSISAPPTYLVPTVSCAVNMRNKEGLSADITDLSV